MSGMSEASRDFVAEPGGRLAGELRVPGDKSISHRALMLGAVATGTTRVDGFLEGADALATRNALRSLEIEFYLLQMTHAWKMGNFDAAEHHYKNIPISELSVADRLAETTADLLYEAGKSLAKQNSSHSSSIQRSGPILGVTLHQNCRRASMNLSPLLEWTKSTSCTCTFLTPRLLSRKSAKA